MARLTEKQKEDILNDFHTGAYSKNQLATMHDTSHTTINKLTKGLSPKHIDKVSTLVTIKTELNQESFKQVSAIETAVNELTKHTLFFRNTALRNQQQTNKIVDAIVEDENEDKKQKLFVLDTHSKITAKNKETVLGKQSDTQVNIQNNNAIIENKTLDDFYTE